jgi:hypothetical protein
MFLRTSGKSGLKMEVIHYGKYKCCGALLEKK